MPQNLQLNSPSQALLGSTIIAFTPNIPAGVWQAMPQSVTGPLNFTQALDPVFGSLFSVALTADGTHVPTLQGASLAAQGWVNLAGTVNAISFVYNPQDSGPSCWMPIVQPNSVVIPAVASLSVPHGFNPVLTIATNGSALVLGQFPFFVPDPSTFAVNRAPTTILSPPASGLAVKSVAVNSSSIVLTLSGTILASDTVTLSYTPTYPGAQPFPMAQDASGNLLAAITNAAVTVT